MTPEITLRQLFAVEALTFFLIDLITLSTSGVVASPSRTSPIAGRMVSGVGKLGHAGQLATPPGQRAALKLHP
ncbi:MAG TPA: hypothetical protein VK964_00525 [Nocardioidaceae bacterium]|nr:hypothetical protein [Nocardioidaceae bacterium]